jgi:tetratricopeptide (TPR) repeat protein
MATDRFSRADVLRILSVSEKQLAQWEKLELVASLEPNKAQYDFRDLINVKTAKQLVEKGVSPVRLRRSLQALNQKLSEIKTPLNELRIVSDGKDILVQDAGSRLEPLSGQLLLTFKTQELADNVLAMPENPQAIFAMALEYDNDPNMRKTAAETYERVIALEPDNVDALLNRGTIAYEQGDLETAAEYFQRAVEVEPGNAVGLFNWGSTLDDLGQLNEARQQLRLATRIDPDYADAHYNLAIVCEKMNAESEARDHWNVYLKLEPSGRYAEYARARLA